ncbi:MAG: acyl--CoA ligase [Pseudorhodoplanes sp.]|nr:acyl--CoA ligase [Pseudorhodoplanes sp.]
MIGGVGHSLASGATLEGLFRAAVARRPEGLALVDPPNREAFTHHPPRTLTYAQADRAVSAVAARLRDAGLKPGAIVAIQLPNVAEHAVAILGVLRAGMIPALLPLLWRKADCVAALSQLDPRALIVCGRIGSVDHGMLGAEVAAEIFSIRHVFGFGTLPDGLTALDDVFLAGAPSGGDAPPVSDNVGQPIAAVTFEVTAAGHAAVARTDAELIAAARGPIHEADLPENAVLLAPYLPSSFAGLSLTLVPWLASGGTLILHHPFDPDALSEQIAERSFDLVVLPGAIAQRLAEAGLLSGHNKMKAILLVWRTPERVGGVVSPRLLEVPLIDVRVFGEIGLVAARREMETRPAILLAGPIKAYRAGTDSIELGETVRTQAGTLAIKGPMVPHTPFPAGAQRTALQASNGDAVDTGYPCRIERDAIVITGPPTGIVSLGGYRFALKDLQDRLGRVQRGCTLAALPHHLVGYKLAGDAADRTTLRRVLTDFGANPLIVGAFRERSERSPAA